MAGLDERPRLIIGVAVELSIIRLPESCERKRLNGGSSMGGFSIYLVFVAAGLIAAPRRLPNYAVVAVIAVTAFWVYRDIPALKATEQSGHEASTSDARIVVSLVDDARIPIVAASRLP